MHRRRRSASNTDRPGRRGNWSRCRPERFGTVRTAARGRAGEVRLAVVSRARQVATEGSRPETRRVPSGGFFPGLEELVNDPAGGAPDDVVADCVVVDPILLLADAAGLAGMYLRVEQLIDGDDQQAAHLIRCQP